MNDTAINSLFNKLENKIKELEGRIKDLENKHAVYGPLPKDTSWLERLNEEIEDAKSKCKIKSSTH